MTRVLLAALTAAGLGAAWPAAADYAAGVAAYQRGDRFRGLEEFRRAAEAGDGRAQMRLGEIYQQGSEVLQDFVIAHMWFDLAAAQDQPQAAQARDAVARRMTAEQVARAQNLTRQRLAMNEPAPQPVASVATPEGKIGKREIAEVQRRLTALGFEVGKPDGKLGKRTRDAIREYQRTHAMPVTGEVDHQLLTALQGEPGTSRGSRATGRATTAATTAPAAPSEQSLAASGRLRGYTVEVQQELLHHGYYRGPIDGTVSPGLRGAIREYQDDAGLSASGQISETLLEHLRYARPEVYRQQRAGTR